MTSTTEKATSLLVTILHEQEELTALQAELQSKQQQFAELAQRHQEHLAELDSLTRPQLSRPLMQPYPPNWNLGAARHPQQYPSQPVLHPGVCFVPPVPYNPTHSHHHKNAIEIVSDKGFDSVVCVEGLKLELYRSITYMEQFRGLISKSVRESLKDVIENINTKEAELPKRGRGKYRLYYVGNPTGSSYYAVIHAVSKTKKYYGVVMLTYDATASDYRYKLLIEAVIDLDAETLVAANYAVEVDFRTPDFEDLKQRALKSI